uniref:uncharacterized protein K02A2.6-like n=1 Tax=Styela clava TaxID=7725 RepID=UPI001939C3B3|nr:uncharacterized protein K02A2.6-like [Styela clava]
MSKFNSPRNLSLEGNLSENWRKFKQQFEIYLEASGDNIKSDITKVAILLNFAGEDAVEIYNNFDFAEADDRKKLDKVIEKFENYCNQRKNVVFERHQFWQSSQDVTETIDQFVTKLRSKVKSCAFKEEPEDMIRDCFIFNMRDHGVKERLLREDELTLVQAINMARAAETSKQQIHKMDNYSIGSSVDNIRQSKNKNSFDKTGTRQQWKNIRHCKYCGGSHVARACPAFGKKCRFCNKIGHFEKVCRTKREDYKSSKERVMSLISEDEDVLMFSVDSETEKKWFVDFNINKQLVKFKLDSGADCNVMSKKTFDGLRLRRLKINPTRTNMRMYDGRKVEAYGKVSIPCSYKGLTKNIDILLVNYHVQPVLGLPSCMEWELIKRVNTLTSGTIENQYDDVFTGLGLIKGSEYKITIDPNVTPVVHAPRRIPIAIRDSLKSELDRMEKLNVIKKVNIPTDWVNSMVMVRKKNNKLRICIDPTDLNKAIKRSHFPMQSIEDVVSRMPNAKVFSVLDANHGFWQVKLSKESCKLCTFNTPFGRYCFQRLPFGIKSAPEVFQQIMSHLLENLEGVEVIIDDLLIWGENVKQHDERLVKVLEIARKSNLKLNRSKCRFRLNEVSYIGHLLTDKGLKPDPNKVKAVQDMPVPENVKDLQRFLGVITYLAKFIPNLSQIAAPLRNLLEKDLLQCWDILM